MNITHSPDLISLQFEMSAKCDELIGELERQGEMLAQAQYNYYKQKNCTAYRLKYEGFSATMIQQILKGEPEVAELMRERDIAKSRYDATKETINVLKLQLRVNDNQISREWGRNE